MSRLPGLSAMAALEPALRISREVLRISCTASTWKVTLADPASA